MTVAALLLTAALMPQDLPMSERVARLAPHFSPKPGEEIVLERSEMESPLAKTKPQSLRGTIRVSPPPGVCFIITRVADQPDDRICAPKNLTFNLGDLDKAGRVAWRIVTGENDFGTELTWPTPYRIAIVTPFDKEPTDPPVYRFIKTCEASKDSHGRRIKIGLFSGETWLVRFPDADQLEVQPKPIPNLFIRASGGKVSVKEAAKQKEAEAQAKAAEAAGAPAAEHGEEAPEHGKEGEAPNPKKADEAPDQDDDRAVWAIPNRDSNWMGGSGFMPYGSVPPGGHGRCRYNYTGPIEDPGTGRLECHDVDGFRDVLLPLTCLRNVK